MGFLSLQLQLACRTTGCSECKWFQTCEHRWRCCGCADALPDLFFQDAKEPAEVASAEARLTKHLFAHRQCETLFIARDRPSPSKRRGPCTLALRRVATAA